MDIPVTLTLTLTLALTIHHTAYMYTNRAIYREIETLHRPANEP